MHYRVLSLMAFALFFIGCEPKEEGNIHIQGKVPAEFSGKQVYLFEVTAQVQKKIDSALVEDDGEFDIIHSINNLDFYQFGFDHRNRINLGLQPNEDVQLIVNNSQLELDYQVSGSPESERIQEVISLQIDAFQKQDSIGKAIQVAQQQQDVVTYSQLSQIGQKTVADFQQALASFASENSTSIAALVAIQQLNIDENFEVFDKVVNDLKPSMANHFFYESIAQMVESKRKLAVGATAPDLEFPNPQGELIAISDFRGKYVLLDFWASWCKPCRMENPNVVKMYNKYNSKGFEIVGISLDQKQQAWISAISQDNLTWPQMSDLGGWQAQPAQVYGVRSIPATFLLDPEGKIIAKNLRGPALESKLEELFGV